MKIGELARAAGCSTQTIRFYEREGLLPDPHRSESNYRHYNVAHLERLRFIRNCRALVMSHDEIHNLLGLMDRPDGDCHAIDGLLDEHIGHVESRIAELEQLHAELNALRERCGLGQSVEDCGIVRGLAEIETELPPRGSTHLG